MRVIFFIIFTILDLFLFKIYFKLVFLNKEDFYDSVKYNFIPDIFSLFRGEYFKDKFAEFKLGFFIFLCIVTILAETSLASWIINIF